MESRNAEPMYEKMHDVDDHEELLSSTDVDESPAENEKSWRRRERDVEKGTSRRHLQPTSSTDTLSYRIMIDTILLAVIICLLLVVLLREQNATPTRAGMTAATSRQIGGDYTGGAPTFTSKVVKWNADEAFVPANMTEWFTAATLARWNSLMPNTAGLDNAPQSETFYTTTMTHQLHCIFMMGQMFAALSSPEAKAAAAAAKHHALAKDYESHYLHCVDYLRQSVMCAGDVAMEEHSPTETDNNGPLDAGWSGRHVCKDYGEVTQFLEQQVQDKVRVVLPLDD